MIAKLKRKWNRVPPTQRPALSGTFSLSLRMKGVMQAHIAARVNWGMARLVKSVQSISTRLLK